MRRPLLLVFVIILFISFICTNLKDEEDSYKDEKVEIVGTVIDKDEKAKYDEYRVDDFLVRDYSRQKKLSVGSKVSIVGKFKSLNDMKYTDFNYGRYLKSTGVKGLIYIERYSILGTNKLYELTNKLKQSIKNDIKYLYKQNSDFINSLILGEKNELSNDDKDMFSRTGTSHVIAISGLHTGILCVLITFIIGGINRVYKLFILMGVMFIYILMVGSTPSIIRAVIFISILYLSIFLDRKKDGISTLSFIGIILVINNPHIIYNLSFQLSFLSTLSIIYFYGYINNLIKISIISLTLASNILTLPIIYYNFNGIPIISVISNIIIVPFVGMIIYMSLSSVVVFKISIIFSKFIAYVNSIVIDSIYFLLYKLSDLEFAYIEVSNPKIFYVIIYYIAVFSYMIYKELKVMKEQANELQGYYK